MVSKTHRNALGAWQCMVYCLATFMLVLTQEHRLPYWPEVRLSTVFISSYLQNCQNSLLFEVSMSDL